MFKKSRSVVAIGLVTVLGVSGIAVAGGTTGADLNDTEVVGSVKPSKLDKKKFKPVDLFLGVVNSDDSTGQPAGNAASEMISISKNVKVDLKKAPLCTAALPNGTTTEAARDACPAKSFLGEGQAIVKAPTAACGPGATQPCVAGDQVVSVFNGPAKGQLRLHTYGTLGTASPTVQAFIVKSDEKGYGQALSVPATPETGALKITSFNATVEKSTKVASAKCNPKKIKFLRVTGYKDSSSDEAKLSQNCKAK